MPRERLTIVPSFKVKRLARLFEVSGSPKKVMASKKDKNARKEKMNKIRMQWQMSLARMKRW